MVFSATEYKEVCRLALGGYCLDALDMLRKCVVGADNNIFGSKDTILSAIDTQYSTAIAILNYAANAPSEQSALPINNIIQDILALADEARDIARLGTDNSYYYQCKNKYSSTVSSSAPILEDLLNKVIFNHNCIQNTSGANSSDTNNNNHKSNLTTHEETLFAAIDYIIYVNKLSKQDTQALQSFFTNASTNDMAAIVPAFMLGCSKRYSADKISFLAKLCRHANDVVRIRSVVAIIILCYLYNERIQLDSELTEEIRTLTTIDCFRRMAVKTYIQLIRSKHTVEMAMGINDLKKNFNISLDAQNPLKTLQSKDIFDPDSPVFKKIEQSMNSMVSRQMAGEDLYFSRLKQPTLEFQKLGYWFMPFSRQTLAVFNAEETVRRRGSTESVAAKAIAANPMICDFDRFTLYSAFSAMGDFAKNMQIPQELAGMEGAVKDDERFILSRFVFNLYRFYEISAFKSDFPNPFKSSLSLYNTIVFNWISDSEISDITNVCHEKGDYNTIIKIINHYGDRCTSDIFFRKKGVALLNLGEYISAIEMFEKANLMCRRWSNFASIAQCYAAINAHSKAALASEMAVSLRPDDADLRLASARYLLDADDVESALKDLYYVDFNLECASYDHLFYISHCLMLKSQPQNALQYIDRAASIDPKGEILLRKAICHLSLSEKDKASAAFRTLKSTLTTAKDASADTPQPPTIQSLLSDKKMTKELNALGISPRMVGIMYTACM